MERQRGKMAFFLLIGLLWLGLPVSALALTFNLTQDWSDSQNPTPTGWAYMQGTALLPHQAAFWISQPGYAWVPVNQTGHTPVWLKATADYHASGLDLNQGDVTTHGTDPYNTGGSGEGYTAWTSAYLGSVQISGKIWYATNIDRSVDWFLYFNTTLLDSGTVHYNDGHPRSDPVLFGTFTEPLAPGDVVKFETRASSGSVAHFVGVDLTLDVAQIPLPPTAWLLGAGLVGLLGWRPRG